MARSTDLASCRRSGTILTRFCGLPRLWKTTALSPGAGLITAMPRLLLELCCCGGSKVYAAIEGSVMISRKIPFSPLGGLSPRSSRATRCAGGGAVSQSPLYARSWVAAAYPVSGVWSVLR